MKLMKISLPIAALASALAFAQPPSTIHPGQAVASAVVNANFQGLYNGRVGRWTGAGAPGDLPFSLIGDEYFNTSAPGQVYACYRVHCTAVAANNWVLVSGTGGGTIAPSTNVLRGDGVGNATSAGFAPTATGIISLFTACSGAQYLGADGACHNASGAGTVVSFAGSGPSWLTWTVLNSTSTPAASLAPTTGQTPHQVIGTCGAATTFAPCPLVAGDLPSTVVNAVTNDTNVTGSISGQTLTLGWAGVLAKARIIATAVYNDQANAYSTGLQDFRSAQLAAPVGTSNPASCSVGQVFFRSDAAAGQNWFLCTALNTWTQVLSGGGNTLTTVSFSGTPTFTRSSANQEFVITLTGNVTVSALSGAAAGDILVFNIIQDATGGRSFAWPTGFSEACTVASAANIGTKQAFYWDGSAAHAITPCVTTSSTNDLVLTDAANIGTSGFGLDATAAAAGAVKVSTPATGDATTAAADTAYVASALASVNPAVAVQAATTTVLSNTPTYSNGTAGVGATLTAGSNGALTIDGYAVLLNDRILVKNQASALQNGVYTETTLGTGGVAYVLTRATDYNSTININYTGTIPVLQGSTNGNTGWNLTTQVATIGTNSLTYTQAPAGSSSGPPGGNVKASGALTNGDVIVGAGGKTIQDSGVAFSSVTRTICAGTVALGTSAIASGAKDSTKTMSCTGAVTTDIVRCSANADISGVTGWVPSAAGTLGILPPFATSNTINVIVENNTLNSITPGAVTLNCGIWR